MIRTFGFMSFGPLLPLPVSDAVGGGGAGVSGEGGTETPAAASNDMAASVLPGPAHCMPRTGAEDASSTSEGLAPTKKGLLWAWRTGQQHGCGPGNPYGQAESDSKLCATHLSERPTL